MNIDRKRMEVYQNHKVYFFVQGNVDSDGR